ncbi:hypothetical protein TNCV_3620901 [Trichonephila clavipes]|nr:hypothetical protein TNCV_3620901 [Trichonephila clavipes]
MQPHSLHFTGAGLELDGIYFHHQLLTSVTKSSDIPPLVNQLALKTINGIYIQTEARKAFRIPMDVAAEHGIPIFKEFFTMQELNMALSNLDPSKSPGPDNIQGQLISRLSDWGKKSLLEIFNRLGRLPRDWKKALIIPIKIKQESLLS